MTGYNPIASDDRYQTSLATFVASLLDLLSRPVVGSVWLESFYSAKHERQALNCTEPQHDTLRVWIAWPKKNLGIDRDWAGTVVEFCNDLNEIARVWGIRLLESPQIIWDEMTGLVQSKFFFLSDSTKIFHQEPEPPNTPNVSQEHIAMISRTSSEGDIKGVLSIWPPV